MYAAGPMPTQWTFASQALTVLVGAEALRSGWGATVWRASFRLSFQPFKRGVKLVFGNASPHAARGLLDIPRYGKRERADNVASVIRRG